jgi:RNA recognition motif. (a.k.a. RRM, RBD, or RNP domain)
VEFRSSTDRDSAIEYLISKKIESSKFIPNKSVSQIEIDAGIVIKDIPLGTTINEIRSAASHIGEIKNITVSAKGGWQTANINFYQKDEDLNLSDLWSIWIKKDSCRVIPRKAYQETNNIRAQFTVKLTNLLPGCTAFELEQILNETGAKTCFIPRTRTKYNRMGIAFISFASNVDGENAIDKKYSLRNHKLVWTTTEHKTCNYCHQSDHLIAECQEKFKTKQQIKWNAEQTFQNTANQSFSHPKYSKSTNKDKFVTKDKTFAHIAKTNISLENNIKNREHTNNTTNEWEILKGKLDRMENNLENAFKMIDHLAEKLEIQLPKQITLENNKHKKPIQDKNHSQEFNILNNRIDVTLEQFSQLKQSINNLANIIQKNNSNQTMETELTNNNNNDSTPKWN